MSKIKSFTRSHVSETEQKSYHHYYEGKVYKSKEASFIPSSVKKPLVLKMSYGWKVGQRKFHSVCNEIKKGNFKNLGLAWGIHTWHLGEK